LKINHLRTIAVEEGSTGKRIATVRAVTTSRPDGRLHVTLDPQIIATTGCGAYLADWPVKPPADF